MASGLILQFVLILLNAFFAASEMAFVSLNENVVRYQAEEGDRKAKRLLTIVSQPTGFLSTIQIGITLAGFLGSAFAADSFAEDLTDWFNGLAFVAGNGIVLPESVFVVLITLVLSFFSIVCGELVPKKIAIKNAEKEAKLALEEEKKRAKLEKKLAKQAKNEEADK